MRQAYKYRRPYLPGLPVANNSKCPVCGQPDSATHMLNACEHKAMKALYIERHNSSARMIAQEVLRGSKGNADKIIADIGSEEKMRGLGCFDTRLTNVLSEQDMAHAGMTAADRDKMRPDLMLIEGTKRKRQRHSSRPRCHILEVGYTNEISYEEKLKEKRAQHERLEYVLKTIGYKVQTHTVIVGSTGGIFKESMNAIEQLGVSKDRCKRLAEKLSVSSIKWVRIIVKHRRLLEQEVLFGTGRPKKPPDK